MKLVQFTGDVDDSPVFVEALDVEAIFSMMEKLHRFTVVQLRSGRAFKVSETPHEVAEAVSAAVSGNGATA